MEFKRGGHKNKKAQLTIFIIIAIIIVASVSVYFILKTRGEKPKAVPKELLPVYSYFSSCIEENAIIGAEMLGVQGGYIYLPDFEPGSDYAPFSSQLNFLGFAVPYWYYVSGNGVVEEQVPSKNEMQRQLERYVRERIGECDFSSYAKQGFDIELDREDIDVDVKIEDTKVKIKVNSNLNVGFEDKKSSKPSHEVEINSRVGKFYKLAKKIYNKENRDLFLENYAVDVLYLYAPVTGTEMSCSPKIWSAHKVADQLYDALEANINAIKVKGNYYRLSKEENKYFVQDIETDENVNFIYNKEWPSRVEIWPADGNLLIAKPVGLEQGLGILGFCYVPYHFVYDVSFPVLIQIYDEQEIFQFPVAVVVQRNMPREADSLDISEFEDPELCQDKYKNTKMDIYTYNTLLEPVEADISFSCLDVTCDVGKTRISGVDESYKDAHLSALFPQCVNGIVIARADGYLTKKYQISTNQEGTTNILLDRLYEFDLELELGGRDIDLNKSGEEVESAVMALVHFVSPDRTVSLAYPEQKKIELSEAWYNVTVQIYDNSTIELPETTTTQCVETPKSGILGVFGATEEKCFDIKMPAQTISLALAGGGKASYYAVESILASSSKLKIKAEKLPTPRTIEEVQRNYNLFETKKLEIEFE